LRSVIDRQESCIQAALQQVMCYNLKGYSKLNQDRGTKLMRTLTFIAAIFLFNCQIDAQEGFPQPQEQHEWLQQFIGEWTTTSKSVAGDGQPQVEGKGSVRSEKLGEMWVINHMTAEMGPTSVKAILTLGYDSTKKKFVGTWVDSMMGHLWVYDGELDETGKKLMLTAEGPNFMTGSGTAKYRDNYEFKSADLVAITSEALNEDGEWVTYMTGEMRRTDK
jgi:hypothetical protein